ncbi:MAG: MBL fold metallo-hydrolase [Propionibacteriaceae bacterium]|jgi:glyoxylase-like metal-dependent hydrolase (beta-lactamase superfamily II)|nr:MBL fold metallo-hydrolase [Propionibacteriaceae bacterium]
MFLGSFASGPWQANCYLLADEPPSECVIIDPGVGAADTVRQAVIEHQLTPAAILATHGHIDHIASAAILADEYRIPLYIDPADRHLLTDPAAGLDADAAALAALLLPDGLAEPQLLEGYSPTIEVAGFTFQVAAAPGHTRGSVLLTPTGLDPRITFTGDVLFAGSIGRTDFPGGNRHQMRVTLDTVVKALPPDTIILPGHGPTTTMSHELQVNPYLK